MKNRVALVFVGNIEFCPYVKNYTSILDKHGIAYDVFYWDRANLETVFPPNYHRYTLKSELLKNKIKKGIDFWHYREWLLNKINEYNFDGIVFLETLSAVLLYNNVQKNRIPFIMEIRDYSYEKNIFFRKIEEKIIRSSFVTFISSPGFTEFLPSSDYKIMHNISNYSVKRDKRVYKRKPPYVLAWTGSIRYYETQASIINQLGNDDRFIIKYHGMGPQLDNLRNLCKDNHIKNVFFTGRYEEKQKKYLLKDVDLILNAYDISAGPEVKYALSNRFYDGLIFRIPQLVENGSFKNEIVENNMVGLSFVETGLGDVICRFLDKLDYASFDISCSKLLKNYYQDNKEAKHEIKRFFGV